MAMRRVSRINETHKGGIFSERGAAWLELRDRL